MIDQGIYAFKHDSLLFLSGLHGTAVTWGCSKIYNGQFDHFQHLSCIQRRTQESVSICTSAWRGALFWTSEISTACLMQFIYCSTSGCTSSIMHMQKELFEKIEFLKGLYVKIDQSRQRGAAYHQFAGIWKTQPSDNVNVSWCSFCYSQRSSHHSSKRTARAEPSICSSECFASQFVLSAAQKICVDLL